MATKPIYINGEFVESHSKKDMTVVSPMNQEILARVYDCKKEDVDLAVQSAKDALVSWQTSDFQTRLDYSRKFIQYCQDHKDEILNTIVLELGSSLKYSKVSQFQFYLDELNDLLDMISEYEFIEHRKGYDLVKEPVGLVACITPWNYPLGQITKKVIPALCAGNTVILKPSSQTPLTALWVAKAIDVAGFPKGTFNLVTGKGSKMGDLLTDHPDINMVTFTGSTSVGTKVAKAATKSMKRIAMELGGKSVSLILEGADLEKGLKRTCDTVFYNSGQTCSALTRLLIPEQLKDEIYEKLIELAASYKIGHPLNEETDLGPVQSFTQFETVRKYVLKGLDEGAHLLVGEVPKDMWIKPTIFVDVDNSMTIAQEEIFGPVLSVITYKTVEEAIEIANDSQFGLSGAVYGPQEKALEVAKQLKTGNVFVNATSKALNVPFGGYKYSGIGRENGVEGFEEFLELKALIL